MSPSELQALFAQIADLDPQQREQFYQSNSIPAEVRAELESLISFDQQANGQTLNLLVTSAAADWSFGNAPEFCGPYRLVRLVAQGGMGAVYLGERIDGELIMQVAVKLIHSAIAGAKNFETRFLKERQILASLSHPGIARLLDAGRTPDRGVPYLVMEFVDGVPIDVYCIDKPLDARIRVLIDVCDAVAYLHRNLVIHRDLKPSNILVDATGHAKLLDFGIAKILDEVAADAGMTQEMLLTPEYASPEQTAGLATTTATDIYSLGKVLRKISGTEEDGRGALRQDLRSIVEMCLREEPERRYATADALAGDLRAALESRPVRARSGNRTYQMGRFVRRHWISTTAVVSALLVLTGALIFANRERSSAEARFSQLRALAQTVFRFDESLRNVPGTTKAREEVVSASLAYLDGLNANPAALDRDPALALEVANGYKLVGNAQGSPRTANLGKLEPAKDNLEKASNIIERLLARDPRHQQALILGMEVSADLASVGDYLNLVDVVQRQSDLIRKYTSTLKSSGFPADERTRLRILSSLATVGLACSNTQQLDRAAEHLRQGIELAEPLPPSSTKVQLLSNMSSVLRRKGELEDSLRMIERAYEIHKQVKYPSDRVRLSATYSVLTRLGSVLGEDETINLGRGSDAVAPLREALQLSQDWVAKDPNDAAFRDRVVKTSRVLGDILRHSNPAEALAVYENGIEAARALKNVSGKRDEARLLAKTAFPLRKLGRADEGQRRIDAALERLKELGLYPPKSKEFSEELDSVIRCLAEHQFETGHADAARKTYEQWMAWVKESDGKPQTLGDALAFARLYEAARRTYLALGMATEAEQLQTKRRELWMDWDKKLPGNRYIAARLAE
jgi:serine/threonine protein kinase